MEITYGGPAVLTDKASDLRPHSATLNATVNAEGETVSDCDFEYGTTLAYGKIAPCTTLPGSGTTPVPVSAEVSGLKANTIYHYRVVATNPAATRHGQNVSFATVNLPVVLRSELPASKKVPRRSMQK